MFVSIQVRDHPGSPAREHLERRLRAAAQAYGNRVSGVALRATSPSPGKVACRVALSLDLGVCVGTARGANLVIAAEQAIARAERAATRAVRVAGGAPVDVLGFAADGHGRAA